MTVLLVMFLFLFFVGTDHVVRLASRRAAARRESPPKPAATPYAALTKRA
jgi:hypothetical protein